MKSVAVLKWCNCLYAAGSDGTATTPCHLDDPRKRLEQKWPKCPQLAHQCRDVYDSTR